MAQNYERIIDNEIFIFSLMSSGPLEPLTLSIALSPSPSFYLSLSHFVGWGVRVCNVGPPEKTLTQINM